MTLAEKGFKMSGNFIMTRERGQSARCNEMRQNVNWQSDGGGEQSKSGVTVGEKKKLKECDRHETRGRNASASGCS